MRAIERDAKREEARRLRPREKREAPAAVKPKCYVCGTEMPSRVPGGGKVQGGICSRCMGDASRKAAEVRRNREAAERRARK
jgi:hypothetical protein